MKYRFRPISAARRRRYHEICSYPTLSYDIVLSHNMQQHHKRSWNLFKLGKNLDDLFGWMNENQIFHGWQHCSDLLEGIHFRIRILTVCGFWSTPNKQERIFFNLQRIKRDLITVKCSDFSLDQFVFIFIWWVPMRAYLKFDKIFLNLFLNWVLFFDANSIFLSNFIRDGGSSG